MERNEEIDQQRTGEKTQSPTRKNNGRQSNNTEKHRQSTELMFASLGFPFLCVFMMGWSCEADPGVNAGGGSAFSFHCVRTGTVEAAMWTRVWETLAAAEETPHVLVPQMRREIVEVGGGEVGPTGTSATADRRACTSAHILEETVEVVWVPMERVQQRTVDANASGVGRESRDGQVVPA